MGIRFKSGIATVAKYEREAYTVEEYGFIIARQDHLDAAGTELTLDFPKVAKGVAYNKTENIDVVFDSTNDDVCIFTGVLKGIPENHYSTNVVCKTYTIINVDGQNEVVYGEAVITSIKDFEKQYYKIVSLANVSQDENGLWRHYYNIYNLTSGTKPSGIQSSKGVEKFSQLSSIKLDAGTVVKLSGDGAVDENAIGKIDLTSLVWIKSMDETSMTVVPVDETAECKNCVTKYMESHTGTTYKDFLGNEQKSNLVTITENTKFLVMKRSYLNENFFVDASIQTVALSDAVSNNTNVLCYNSRCQNRNGSYVTKYAEYKKALILPNANGEAVFVIIIVNDHDAAALNVACENCQ